MNRSMKTAVLAVVSVCCMAFLSCSGSGNATVNISLNLPKNVSVLKSGPDTIIDRVLRLLSSAAVAAPEDVTSIAVQVSGPGMDTFERTYPADTEQVTLAVESGNSRKFVVKAYKADGRVWYAGADTVDLASGETRTVVITMRDTLRLVEDINQVGSGGYTDPSSPDELTLFNDKVYFSASDGINGRELWRYDKNSENVSRITDAYSGFSGSLPYDVTDLKVYNNRLFFAASGGIVATDGSELWYINSAEVVQVPFDVYQGPVGSNPTNLSVVDGKLFFSASGYNGTTYTQSEPYVHDGSGNPELVYDISSMYGSSPFGFTLLNGMVYFFAQNDYDGYAVYKYDGIDVEPTRVEIPTGGYPSIDSSCNPVVFNGKLYYVAGFDGVYELYAFDESENINVSSVSLIDPANQENVTVLDGNLYFPARDAAGIELWAYNGIYPAEPDVDIARITDVNPETGDSTPSALTPINGLLYFGAYGGGEVTYLYSYNPNTYEATPALQVVNGVADIRKLGNVIAYLDAPDQDTGNVWIYDPAKPVDEGINPHSVTNSLEIDRILLVQGNRLYLSADDGVHGIELWVYDHYE